MFDAEGKAELVAEAIVAVNANKKLREGLKVDTLSTMIKGYQAHVRRYDGQILTTVQTSEEGQESIDLAGAAASDMSNRIKVFSESAAALKAYVDEFRQETRPLELAQAHIKTCLVASEKLAALSEGARELRALQISNDGKSEYFMRAGGLIEATDELWAIFSKHEKHPRLASLRQVIEASKATLSVNCRSEFKGAQQLLGRGLEVDRDVMLAAARAVDALGMDMLQEIIDGYCSWAAYNFYLPWVPNDAPPDAPWTCEDFKSALNRVGEFVEGKIPEMQAVFPPDWGMPRQLCRRVLREAQQTLKTRLSDLPQAFVRSNISELVAMVRAGKEFESEVEKLWEQPKRDFISAQSCDIKGSLSATILSFLTGFDSSYAALLQPGGKKGAVPDPDQPQAAVFTLDDLDMEESDKVVEAESPSSPRNEWAPGGHSELGDLTIHDLQPLSIECLILCTVLNGGSTSYGQHETDKDGLNAARVQAEITNKGYKSMLFFLDLPSRDKHNEHFVAWSLEYRLLLLKLCRPDNFPVYKFLGRTVEFKEWRDAQLRLIVAMARAALGQRDKALDTTAPNKNLDAHHGGKALHDNKVSFVLTYVL